MSFTITAQAIPAVAGSEWDVVDEHLLRRQGDWRILRAGLIHAVCQRVSAEGDPVSRLEEFLLCRFYEAPPVHVGFRTVLATVREELARWPEPVRHLVEHGLAENPTFPVGEAPFPLSFDRLRANAPRATVSPGPPVRDLSYFRGSTAAPTA
jgi:hypothetical protein